MDKPANKARGEVALPEAGEGVFLRFTTDALERLESEYGEDYLDVIMGGLTKARVKIYKTALSVSIQAADAEAAMKAFPWETPLEKLQPKILDGIYLTVTGRTFDEQQKHEDEVYLKRLEEAQENPRLAAALLSKLSAAQDTAPASDQPKSES